MSGRLYVQTFPVSRKDRRCENCERRIPKGTRYLRSVLKSEVTNDRIMAAPWCEPCAREFRMWFGVAEQSA